VPAVDNLRRRNAMTLGRGDGTFGPVILSTMFKSIHDEGGRRASHRIPLLRARRVGALVAQS
jgi:hypothetical protein